MPCKDASRFALFCPCSRPRFTIVDDDTHITKHARNPQKSARPTTPSRSLKSAQLVVLPSAPIARNSNTSPVPSANPHRNSSFIPRHRARSHRVISPPGPFAHLPRTHRGKRSFHSRDARSSDTSASLRTGAVPLAAALALIFSADSLALSVSRAFQWSWNLRLG